MNQLFIIGNGFDLAHGLKTSYHDFLIWYLNKKRDQAYAIRPGDSIEYDNLIRIDTITTNHTFIPNNTVEIKEFKDFEDSMNVLKTHKIATFKYSQLLLKIIDEEGWADIEKEYYGLMIKKVSGAYFHDIKKLNLSLEALKKELEQYLSENVMPEIGNGESLNRIENIFEKENSEDNVFNKEVDKNMYLNFNYTNTLGLYRINGEVINIHGRINKFPYHFIFGYGDEMDKNFKEIETLVDNDYLMNMKSFGYLRNNYYRKLLGYIDEKDFKVHILGHSLGLSDRLLLNTVFEHDNCKSIEIHYHHEDGSDNFNTLTQNLSRHFNADLKGKMRRITVPHDKSDPIDPKL